MEDFVTYEQAQLLKELGFDWSCDMFYATQNYCEGNNPYYFDTICTGDLISNPKYREDENDGWIPDDEWCVAAPTLSQVQKWLREVMRIDITIGHVYHRLNTGDKIMYSLHIGNQSTFKTEFYMNYDSYEESLSVGIDHAIKLYLKNKVK